jgi:ABC-type transport system substrate-binding protein
MRWIRAEAAARREAAVLVLAGLVGCGEPLAPPSPAGHPDDPTPRQGGIVRLGSFGDMRTLDPAGSSDALSGEAIVLLFAGLVDYDASGAIVPDIAERFETTPDAKTYRFFLRPGVRFHDGEELTADDVKRSIERSLHPDTPNPLATAFDAIEGFPEYTQKGAPSLSGVVVEGRYVVAIHLAHPDATFLDLLALKSLRPVCKSAGHKYSDSWAPCGAGPFRLSPGGWQRGRSLRITRWDGYFRPGLPHLDGVEWLFNMNLVAERFKFERGELELLKDFLSPDLVRFQNDPRWKPYGAYERDKQVNGEAMNTELEPFDNVEVRRAVAAVVDRERYRLVKPGALSIVTQPVPRAVPGFDPDFVGQVHDDAAALAHMAKAGYAFDPESGKGGYGRVIPYPVYKQGLPLFTAQLLQQDLAKIGITLDLRILSYPTFLALTRRRGKSQLMPGTWTQDYPDPSSFLEPLFGSRAINDEDSSNVAFYKNPEVDRLLDEARSELDPVRRRVLFSQASRIVCDDAPWAFTYSYRFYTAWQPYLRGFAPHPVWSNFVRDAWIDRASEAKDPLGAWIPRPARRGR